MNQNKLTHDLVRGPHLFVFVALLGGLALALGVVLLAQAAPTMAPQLQSQTLTLLPDQATNLLPGDTSEQFTATVVGFPWQGVWVSFSTDFGQFDGGVQYVEVQTDQFGLATVTVSSNITGTANIRAWIDDNGNNTYDTGELTDDTSTKIWQEEDQPDFGDAPDGYGTLSATIGARHTIVAGRSLGPTVDGESDGQPTANADGDDSHALDDEDGVALQPILVPDTTGIVTVHGGPSGGKLDAWIDFNGNGVFEHTGEHLFGGTSASLAPGWNPPLTFNVPAGADTGTTYARFRLSISGGLGPTGEADDGEVED